MTTTTREPPDMDSELKKLNEQKVLSFLSESFTMFDFARRCRSCDTEINPFDVWKEHAQDVYWGCIAREKDYYRSSKGLTYKSPAKEIDDFKEKGWILRRNPGPYTDYQRLYVGDIMFCDGELIGEYSNLFLSHDADLAMQKCYKMLQSSFEWDTSWSVARRIANDAINKWETERQHIVPLLLTKAIQETLNLKLSEQEKKERVPIYTKVFQEVVREKRDFKEVMIEIKENDAASFPVYSNIIEGKLRRGENLESMGLKYAIDDVKKYINAATKGEQSEEELIPRYCRENDLSVHTYADYVEKKMLMAVNLGITNHNK